MSNRFTRNIQNVGEIQNLPLYTNDQNDLISTDSMVYVRHNNAYEPILNKGVLGSGLTPEDVDRINGLIDDKFKGYTEGAIKELNNDEVTELEQSILNLIGDRLGGLKFDQDGFKTSLNEVLKKLELNEIADVQNLQREIDYIFDENNKSTSKKIDDVKSELSQLIDEKVQQQETPIEDSPIISIEKFKQVLNQENYQVVSYDISLYTNKPINTEDVEIISYNDVQDDNDDNIVKVDTLNPYGNGDNDIKDYYSYYANAGVFNYGTLVVKYKGKVIDVFNNSQILKDDYEKRELEQRISKLEQRIEKLENQ